jgi:LysM repeat protein
MHGPDSSERNETEQNYLDQIEAAAAGPRRWVLAVGALVMSLAILAVFYGLYSINLNPPPSPTPDPSMQTRAAIAVTPLSDTATPGATPSLTPFPSAISPVLTATATITATPDLPTYTVQQGDTLLGIAERLNVDVNQLSRLNQVSGETIYPDQVLRVPPTVTPWPEDGPFLHIVQPGETLLTIANRYNITVDELKNLNGLTSDVIYSEQRLLIPATGVRPPTPTPTPEPWRPAIISGELDVVYSIAVAGKDLDLHILPDSRAADDFEQANLVRLVSTARQHSQQALGRPLMLHIDVYVAGGLFKSPYTNRRAFSQPQDRRAFMVYDGTGSPAERLYFVTYALTRLAEERVLGAASSPLLGEGLAVYAGRQALAQENDRYLTPEHFCIAYQQTNQLPRISRALTFEGHLGHMDQYFAAGCFAGYLIEREGRDAFISVYQAGDYLAVYEQSLAQLESDWLATLQEASPDLPSASFDPERLAETAAAIDAAYRELWADFEGTPQELKIYRQLDLARIAMLQNRLDDAQAHLQTLEALTAEE